MSRQSVDTHELAARPEPSTHPVARPGVQCWAPRERREFTASMLSRRQFPHARRCWERPTPDPSHQRREGRTQSPLLETTPPFTAWVGSSQLA